MQTENERANTNGRFMHMFHVEIKEEDIRIVFLYCYLLIHGLFIGLVVLVSLKCTVYLQELSDIIWHSSLYVVMHWSPSANIYSERRCFRSAVLLLLSSQWWEGRVWRRTWIHKRWQLASGIHYRYWCGTGPLSERLSSALSSLKTALQLLSFLLWRHHARSSSVGPSPKLHIFVWT